MQEIQNRTIAPYRSICYVSCGWADGTFTRASGIVVGVNDVLTAHHVVYNADRGGYATWIAISPAADSSPQAAPLGTWTDIRTIDTRSANWDTNGDKLLGSEESQYDLALIGLRSPIGNTTGWLTASAFGQDFTGEMVGYPARGTGMMSAVAPADALTSWSVFDVAGALGPGASGGPLLRPTVNGTTFVGVLSAGNAALTSSSYAGLYGAGNYLWLMGAIASNDGSPTPSPGYGLRQPQSGIGGSAGDDTISGTDSDDVFLGSQGDDVIDGKSGSDTMSYSGPRSSYRLFNSGSSVIVRDSMTGRDGTDRLDHIERIGFADMTVNLTVGKRAALLAPEQLKLLEELYVAFFNRVPEADGLSYWIDRATGGMTVNEIADAFYSAALLYPNQTGYTASMNQEDFVNHIYRNTLGRSGGADPEGLMFWSNALAQGTETRGSLVRSILWAAHNFKDDITWGWVANLLDNKATVAQEFALIRGLNYNTAEASIAATMAISAAITSTDTAAAISLIGVNDGFVA